MGTLDVGLFFLFFCTHLHISIAAGVNPTGRMICVNRTIVGKLFPNRACCFKTLRGRLIGWKHLSIKRLGPSRGGSLGGETPIILTKANTKKKLLVFVRILRRVDQAPIIQFNSVYFVEPILTNYKCASEGFTICTHRHPWPLTSHQIRNNSQTTLQG